MLELFFRKVGTHTHAVFGVTDTPATEDTWVRFTCGQTLDTLIMLESCPPNPPLFLDNHKPTSEFKVNTAQMDVEEILKTFPWNTAGALGGAILRPSNAPGLTLVMGAMKIPQCPWENETLYTMGHSPIKKDVSFKSRGNIPMGIFREPIWGPDNIGIASTFPPALCRELDNARLMAITAYQNGGKKAFDIVKEGLDSFISETALGSMSRDEKYLDYILATNGIKAFSKIYTKEENDADTARVKHYLTSTGL